MSDYYNEYQKMESEHLNSLTGYGQSLLDAVAKAVTGLELDYLGKLQLSDDNKREHFRTLTSAINQHRELIRRSVEERENYRSATNKAIDNPPSKPSHNDLAFRQIERKYLQDLQNPGRDFISRIISVADLLELEFSGEPELSTDEIREFLKGLRHSAGVLADLIEKSIEEQNKYISGDWKNADQPPDSNPAVE